MLDHIVVELESILKNDYPALEIIKKVLIALKEAGYSSYLVGGAVRDFLLKKPISDFDIATEAKPHEVSKLFKCTPTGEKYGSVTALIDDLQIQITTFRSDGNYLDFRHPEEVIFSNNVFDDVFRRDFTINALLMDELEVIHDYTGGLTDLKQRVIRAVGDPIERFNEDALRVLRALYFQSKLGFTIDYQTRQAMTECRENILQIAVERVMLELKKIFRSPRVDLSLKTMYETKIHETLPGIKEGVELFLSKTEMPFLETFFVCSFVLNKNIPSYYLFSNKQKHIIKCAVDLTKKKVLTDYDLYLFGLEISLLANRAMHYLYGHQLEIGALTHRFETLIIKSETDIALSSREILTITNKKAIITT